MQPGFKRVGDIFLPGEEKPSFVYIAASTVSSIGAATTSASEVVVFDAQAVQITHSFVAHDTMINGIDINESSQLLLTCCEGKGSRGNEVALWDLRSMNKACAFKVNSFVHYCENCRCVSSSKNGLLIGAGTNSGVLTWDVRKPEGKFRHVNIQPDEISSVTFHPFAPSTFLSGDDDGNLLLYDLDSANDEDGTLFYSNDRNPVFQCGFCGVDTVFTLRRTAGMRLWNIIDGERDSVYPDLRELTGNTWNYPIDTHWCGDWLMTLGGDQNGGVAIVMASETDVKLFTKLEKAHKDCVNASHLEVLQSGEMCLYLAGDGGQLSIWKLVNDQ